MKVTYLVLIVIVLSSVFLKERVFAQEMDYSDISKLFEMSIDEMMNIKISTAGKKAEKVSIIPASVVIITREEIEKYGYCTLEEILESIPGLYQVDDWQSGGSNFGVRGFLTDG